MISLKDLIDMVLHVDNYLLLLIDKFGIFSYVILFMVIFLETGLVVTPFLPGDSLLFAAGSFAALGSFRIEILFVALALAAILGDTINYWIGNYLGPKVFRSKSRLLNKEYLDRTHKFYEKYGGMAIILGRFMPIIRTFVPFLAGIGRMSYFKFLLYNIIGGIAWVSLFLFGGYFFGNIPFVKSNFSIVVLVIIVLSLIPIATEFLRHWLAKRKKNHKKK